MAPPSLSLTAQLAAVAADPAAWRFASLGAAFLLLMTFSCAVEEKLFKFLPNFHYYWTTVGGSPSCSVSYSPSGSSSSSSPSSPSSPSSSFPSSPSYSLSTALAQPPRS